VTEPRPPAKTPDFSDRAREVRDWLAATLDTPAAREAMRDVIAGAISDRANLEFESAGSDNFLGQGPIPGFELRNDEPTVEVRLWRRFAGALGSSGAASLPDPRDLSSELYIFLEGRLARGPFRDLRAAALVAVEECLACNEDYFARYGHRNRPVTGLEVAVNRVWWDMESRGLTRRTPRLPPWLRGLLPPLRRPVTLAHDGNGFVAWGPAGARTHYVQEAHQGLDMSGVLEQLSSSSAGAPTMALCSRL
jgi:hypothetical protein